MCPKSAEFYKKLLITVFLIGGVVLTFGLNIHAADQSCCVPSCGTYMGEGSQCLQCNDPFRVCGCFSSADCNATRNEICNIPSGDFSGSCVGGEESSGGGRDCQPICGQGDEGILCITDNPRTCGCERNDDCLSPNAPNCNVITQRCESGGGSTPSGTTNGSTPTSGTPSELPNPLGVRTISELFTKIAQFIITLVMPFAVFMVILAGFRFATAQGSEEKINRAKKNFVWTVTGVAVILASQALISYIEELLGTGGGKVNAFIDRIKSTLNQVIAVLFTLVTVYFIWGIIQYVRAGGDEIALKKGKQHMIWGIVGMSIMGAAWGIVEIIVEYVR